MPISRVFLIIFTSSLLLCVCISDFIDHVGYKNTLGENVHNPTKAAYRSDSYEYQSDDDIGLIAQLKRSALRAMYKKFVRMTRTQGKCQLLYWLNKDILFDPNTDPRWNWKKSKMYINGPGLFKNLSDQGVSWDSEAWDPTTGFRITAPQVWPFYLIVFLKRIYRRYTKKKCW